MSGDDELGRFLRGEVPGPGPGYWDEIEARLQGVEAERDAAELGVPPDPEEISESVQTDGEVIRLRDMRSSTTHTPARRNVMPFLAAAAVIVIAAIGGVIAINRNGDSSTEVEVAETPEVTTTGEVPTTGDVPTDTAPASTAAETPADEIIPACFAARDSVIVTTFSSATAFTGAMIHEGRVSTIAGEATGNDTQYRMAVVDHGTDGTEDGGVPVEQQWFLEVAGMFIADGSFIDAASCDDVRDEVDELQTTIDRFGTPSIADLPAVSGLNRTCLAGDVDVLSIEIADSSGERFTGVYLRGASIQVISAVRLDGEPTAPTGDFRVALQAVGSAEEGAPIVVEEIWTTTEDGLITPDGDLIVVECSDVADRIDPTIEFVGDDRPPFPVVADFSCWIEGLGDGDQIALDDDQVDGQLSGVWLRGDSIQVFTAVALGPETEDGTEYLVALEAIGAAEQDGPVVTEERWATGTDATLIVGDGTGFGLVSCSEVGPELQSAVDFVGELRPAAPTP